MRAADAVQAGGWPEPRAQAATPPAAWGRGERIAVSAGGMAWAIVYASTYPWTSDGFIATDGGLEYAQQVALGQWNLLLHPHHLLYHAAGYALSRLFSPFLDPWHAAILALRLMSAAAGGAAVVLYYLLLRRIAGPRLPAAAATLTLAAAAGFWHFASVMESHMPAIAASLGVLLVLARAAERPTARAYGWAGVVHALAVVIRQDAVLFAPLVCLFALAWGERGRGWGRAAAYAAGLGVPAAAAYLMVYLVGVRGRGAFRSLFQWVTMYAHWGQWGLKSQLSWPSFLSTLDGTLATLNVHLASPLFLPGAAALAVGAVMAARRLSVPGRLLAALCAVWFALRLGFFTWWDPPDAFVYGATTILPLLVLVGLAAAGTAWAPAGRWRAALTAALVCLAPAMLGNNLTGFILPMRQQTNFRVAERWRQVAGPRDLILSNDSSVVMALRYMARLDAAYLPMLVDPAWHAMSQDEVRGMIRARAAQGNRVYLTAEVMEEETVVYDYSTWDRVRGFERRYPVADAVSETVQKGFRWRPLDLGEGPRGPVRGYELVRPTEGKGGGHDG